MRRLRVVLLAPALDDLRFVETAVARRSGSSRLAKAYVRRMREACRRIGDIPWCGRMRDDLRPGLRTTPFENRAVIVYLIEDDRVRITRIYWGGQDWERLYGAPWNAAPE